MKRRQLLRSAAALPLLSGGLAALLGAAAGPEPARRRLRPSDSAWPSAASWAKLKQDVGGNLIEVHELFGSCRAQPNGAACLDALKNMRNPYWIGDQPAGTEVSGWLDAWTPAPSVYAIKARNARDVAASINFARDNNLRLVVKGGGHSYLGTSNAKDSLLIWTRGMHSVTLHSDFVAQGCAGSAAPVSAVSTEAGAMWMDLYDAVTTLGGRFLRTARTTAGYRLYALGNRPGMVRAGHGATSGGAAIKGEVWALPTAAIGMLSRGRRVDPSYVRRFFQGDRALLGEIPASALRMLFRIRAGKAERPAIRRPSELAPSEMPAPNHADRRY